MLTPRLTLSEIWIYPVKSLGGTRLEEGLLTERGLRWDRRWMLIDEQGQFMSQRQIAGMSLLKVNIDRDSLEIRHSLNKSLTPLQIPLSSDSPAELTEATIWEDTTHALRGNPQADAWLSEALEQKCHLVFMPEESKRTVNGKTSGRIQKVSFADAYPVLMTGQASLDELNSRLAKPVPMDRFRPNLVFSGGKPFEEDSWHAFTINNTRFWAEKACARCVVTTIDQQTAIKNKEPLATLAKFRCSEGKIMFGQNLLYEQGSIIRTGDPVTVQTFKEGPVIKEKE